MPEKDNSKDHIISAAYYKKFIMQGRELFPYKRKIGSLPAKGVKGIGFAIDYDDIGKNTEEYEYYIKKFETIAMHGKNGPLAKIVNEEHYPETAQERDLIFLIMAFFRLKSPVQIHNYAIFSEMMTSVIYFNSLNDKNNEIIKNYAEIYNINNVNESIKRIRQEKNRILTGEITFGIENKKLYGLASWNLFYFWVNWFTCMNLQIIETKEFFITSDNPIIVKSKDFLFPAIGYKDSFVWFPISNKKGILLSHNKKSKFKNIKHSETRMYNRLIMKYCYDFVYSPYNEDWINDFMKENTLDPLLGTFSGFSGIEKIVKETDGKFFVDLGNFLKGIPDRSFLGLKYKK